MEDNQDPTIPEEDVLENMGVQEGAEILEMIEEEEKSQPAERYTAPEPERDDGRLRVDSSRRLGDAKRLGDDDD